MIPAASSSKLSSIFLPRSLATKILRSLDLSSRTSYDEAAATVIAIAMTGTITVSSKLFVTTAALPCTPRLFSSC